MSDAAAPAAAPAAEAPAPVEATQAKTEAAPDPLAEFENVLKKSPLKYKAGGKERPVTSIKELLRKAEQADGLMSKAQELSAREEKVRVIEERDARLKKAKTGKERAAILREFAGEGFDEAAEEAILERIEREKAMSGLTPTERAAKEEAEQYKAKLAEYEERQRQQEEAERAKQEEAELRGMEEQLAGLAVKALTAAKLPKEAAMDAGRRLAWLMDRAEKLNLALDPDELATEAVSMAGRDFRAYTTGLEGDALIDFLGEAVVRKASKAWLSRMQGGERPVPAVTPSVSATKPPSNGPTTRESPFAMWKKFGL